MAAQVAEELKTVRSYGGTQEKKLNHLHSHILALLPVSDAHRARRRSYLPIADTRGQAGCKLAGRPAHDDTAIDAASNDSQCGCVLVCQDTRRKMNRAVHDRPLMFYAHATAKLISRQNKNVSLTLTRKNVYSLLMFHFFMFGEVWREKKVE